MNIKPRQVWQINSQLSKEETYKRHYPKITKYLNKNIIVISNNHTMYKIYGKLMITRNSNDGEFTVKSSDGKSYITFDSGNIKKIFKDNRNKTAFMLNTL